MNQEFNVEEFCSEYLDGGKEEAEKIWRALNAEEFEEMSNALVGVNAVLEARIGAKNKEAKEEFENALRAAETELDYRKAFEQYFHEGFDPEKKESRMENIRSDLNY